MSSDDQLRNRAALVVLAFVVCPLLAAPSFVRGADVEPMAKSIDDHLSNRLRDEGILPAPPADDAEFLRRLYLDLIGCPPTPDDVRQFLGDARPNKRAKRVEDLLADARHARHFSVTWRALLLPEADSDGQFRYFQPGLEAWLRQRRLEGTGFNRMVRELLSIPIASPDETPELVLRDLKAPNPLAFIASKGGDPGTIAASVTRLFLGIRLECAQCHDHPTESWTQAQFWNQAAFFAGIERRGTSPFSPLTEAMDRREVAITESDATVRPAFLDGRKPSLVPDELTREALADWIVSPENPWFSRAIVNRVWAQLFGEGLVEPIDDFGIDNPPSHPELLDELSDAFVDSGFDLTWLHSAICRTEAYQRTSRMTHSSQASAQRFARMAIKPLSGEQFFAVLCQAIGYAPNPNRLDAGGDEDPVRRAVLNQFATTGVHSDPQTSVSQALTLMNGNLTNDAAASRLFQSRLTTEAQDEDKSIEERVEQLYLLTLGRMPTTAEQREVNAHLRLDKKPANANGFGDVLWALLNSAEFRWNH